MTEERVSDEKLAEAIRNAILSCGHAITADEIVLRRSDKQPGNALNQLHQRILTELLDRRSQDAGGWRLVPVEPTLIMQQAGLRQLQDNLGELAVIIRDPLLCYRAMLAAAPSPTMEPTNDR